MIINWIKVAQTILISAKNPSVVVSNPSNSDPHSKKHTHSPSPVNAEYILFSVIGIYAWLGMLLPTNRDSARIDLQALDYF